jgi:hypothetical protein
MISHRPPRGAPTMDTDWQMNRPRGAPTIDPDWQMGRPLGDCLLTVFQQDMWTDVTFRFPVPGDDVTARIGAHKLVLASRSPVFEAMFYGAMANSHVNEDIEVADVPAGSFTLLLK